MVAELSQHRITSRNLKLTENMGLCLVVVGEIFFWKFPEGWKFFRRIFGFLYQFQWSPRVVSFKCFHFSYPSSENEKLPHNQSHVAQIKSVALLGDQIVWNFLFHQFSGIERYGSPDVIDKVDSYLIFSCFSLHTESGGCVSRKLFLFFSTNQ